MIFKTPAAEDDLINLWRYIARDNPPAADRVHHSAEKTFEAIADMPGIGTAYRSKRAKLHGLRFFPLTQYPTTLPAGRSFLLGMRQRWFKPNWLIDKIKQMLISIQNEYSD